MAPVSVPPEVNLRLLEPPVKGRTASRIEQPRIVEVEGPLGMYAAKPLARSTNHYNRENLNVDTYLYELTTRSGGQKSYVTYTRPEGAQAQGDVGCAVLLLPMLVRPDPIPGTTRAYLQNHVLGVSEGHSAILRLVGVGFRATVEPTATTKQPEYPGQQFVSLKVGYSHPIELVIPEGVKASTPQPTRILLEGPVKEVVMQFAAEIRMWRKPEPYKGKGIFVNGETIKLKAKKIK
jgi:large subunit ribosomal protein L6